MTDVEVDQSGKIEDLAVDTILAFSNGLSRAIRIPAAVKRIGLAFLRRRRVPPKTRYLRMLATGFYRDVEIEKSGGRFGEGCALLPAYIPVGCREINRPPDL